MYISLFIILLLKKKKNLNEKYDITILDEIIKPLHQFNIRSWF